MSVRGSPREAEIHKAPSNVENRKARDKVVLRSTELQSRHEYHCGELHMTPCDWQQFLKVEQRHEDRYDLENGILVSGVGMAGDRDRTCLTGALRELKSRLGTQKRRVQTHGMQNIKLRLAKEASRLGAGRKWVRGSKGSRSSSSSPSEKRAEGGRPGRRRRVEKG